MCIAASGLGVHLRLPCGVETHKTDDEKSNIHDPAYGFKNG